MKTANFSFALCLSVAIMLLIQCTRNEQDLSVKPEASALKTKQIISNVDFSALIAYKNSDHQISAGYYRTWRDSATTSGNIPSMRWLPDSLDMVMVFPNYTPADNPYWNTLKTNYVPYLHKRGTKVIITLGDLSSATTTGGQDSIGYSSWAQGIYNKWVGEYNLDGIDIDVESNPSGATLTKFVAATKALSKYFGPKSGTGKTFVYDTNQNPTNFFTQTASRYNYVFLQAYGRSTFNLTTVSGLYAPYINMKQFLPGFSFYEENGYPGNYWNDVRYPQNGTGRAYDYARWQPKTGKKGGVFSYAIDRDAPLTSSTDNTLRSPNFRVTKDLIKIMNP
ncbi:endo-beta-N-acetylglucosaminidase [Elizabethkingia meningoseptica]|uniref:endo-beta-N-acetylglucosaminidase family protein n=1 Tax=Elizabethkingia meningoseptica TaxID=238 RepID=UPI000332D54E|nr:endo-beta-N-acetylglucosaminidase family protein [Elizabethkingia meningoseptica]AQX06921.1 endo-beta-N-acetylglucosaminidase [Elizabethkingia meningoseptica]AQX48967.1 endo-beta-N-acetylglucosaminidase [Elizabethkingia meningoseptica]EOR29828.1 endo-beta-N-acetylglucosaminidase F2 [Elizabethkingia meningoseptica ATCC 13253 = NBRC 12535]KUY15053.1 endo-beta-N-acetylglucosaminidase [Elizabethkingia meningoseptica]OPB69576.1 endo-beta-N-acetylglucosaminidase [Elizabethkingia meningoseptica]